MYVVLLQHFLLGVINCRNLRFSLRSIIESTAHGRKEEKQYYTSEFTASSYFICSCIIYIKLRKDVTTCILDQMIRCFSIFIRKLVSLHLYLGLFKWNVYFFKVCLFSLFIFLNFLKFINCSVQNLRRSIYVQTQTSIGRIWNMNRTHSTSKILNVQ